MDKIETDEKCFSYYKLTCQQYLFERISVWRYDFQPYTRISECLVSDLAKTLWNEIDTNSCRYGTKLN